MQSQDGWSRENSENPSTLQTIKSGELLGENEDKPSVGEDGSVVADARPVAPEMALMTAVKMGLSTTMAKMLEHAKAQGDAKLSELVNETDDGGHTVTHWAAKGGAVEVLRTLLDVGAPYNRPSSDKVAMFPLHWAATEGHLKVMRELVDRGADTDARDAQGCTALLIAAQYGQADAAAYLIKVMMTIRRR